MIDFLFSVCDLTYMAIGFTHFIQINSLGYFPYSDDTCYYLGRYLGLQINKYTVVKHIGLEIHGD
jgi:hypothetical protein